MSIIKLLIWGTGNYALKFVNNGYAGDIMGFIETNKSMETFMGKPVYDSREIPKEYDYLIVASSYASEIYDKCKELGIDISKCIFLYGVKRQRGETSPVVLKEILLEKNYIDYCGEFGLTDETFIWEDAQTYSRLNKRSGFHIQEKYMWPIITDKYAPAGTVDNYFWQDLWAARLIIASGVKKHFDIGSRLDGFIAHLLAVGIDVAMIDVREFPEKIEGLYTIVDDATNLSQIADESLESISALCSLEHFGLGRYGDPINPEACFQCFDSIQRKLKKGGRFYLSLPIGKERVEFNAHRVFYASTVRECFSLLTLEEFSCTAQGKIEYHTDLHQYDNDCHDGNYRYGLFVFKK